jgi:hypothetical protein
MTWIHLPGQERCSSCLTQAWHKYNFLVQELDSSCLIQSWHECNFLVKNLTHPAWLQHDNYTTSCSWTWLILPDWNMTWIQLHGHELDSSSLTGTWHEYNYMVMNLTHPPWLEHYMNTTTWSWTWLILPDSSMTQLQPSLQKLDSSSLTGTLHEYNFLVMNLTHPAWLEHDMNTTSW